MSRVTIRTPVRRYRDGAFVSRPDAVAGEEPLEIRIGGAAISTTMRTPGADIDLVHGLLHAEGIITAKDDVIAVRYCAGVDSDGQNTYNVLDVTLADPDVAARAAAPRAFVTSSACGVCGTASIEALRKASTLHPAGRAGFRSGDHRRASRPAARRSSRPSRSTGGVHACALASPRRRDLDASGRMSAGTTRWTR